MIAKAGICFTIDETHELEFSLEGTKLSLRVDGKPAVEGRDDCYLCGGAGFVVDSGAILADGFEVRRIGRN